MRLGPGVNVGIEGPAVAGGVNVGGIAGVVASGAGYVSVALVAVGGEVRLAVGVGTCARLVAEGAGAVFVGEGLGVKVRVATAVVGCGGMVWAEVGVGDGPSWATTTISPGAKSASRP